MKRAEHETPDYHWAFRVIQTLVPDENIEVHV
jgi:hypothetical protein